MALVDLSCQVTNFLKVGVVEQLSKERGLNLSHFVFDRHRYCTNSLLILIAHLYVDL